MKKEKIIKIAFISFMYLLIFQSAIQQHIKIFQYFDEMVTILIAIISAIYIIKGKGKIKINKYNIYIVILISIVIFNGLYSNIKYGYQNMKYVLADLIVFIKFFIVYLGFEFVFKDKIKKFSKTILKNIKIITLVLFSLTIINYIFKVFPVFDHRYGIPSNQLFFDHPTTLAWFCVLLMVILIYSEKLNKNSVLYLSMLLIIVMTTLRSKAIAFTTVSILILIYMKISNNKINTWKVIFIGLICIAIGYKQIYYYFMNENGARAVLLGTSIEIANDYFPVGTGFGTFGSYFSGESYSPVYEMYEINGVWGLRQDNPNFISDSFWPMILGQFGYIGALCYMICIIMLYVKLQKSYSIKEKNVYTAKILILTFLIISSTAESAFVNPMAIPLAIILAI